MRQGFAEDSAHFEALYAIFMNFDPQSDLHVEQVSVYREDIVLTSPSCEP
jgi:hypothetical protein